MVKINARMLVFPSILLCAFLLLMLSGSVKAYTVKRTNTSADGSESNQTLSNKYPQSIQEWKDKIEYYADQFELDPNLIAAVILQESGGQPDIISTSGAVGLMQVMPRDGIASTFMCGSNPCFENRPLSNELLNPDFNVHFGTHMLTGLINSSGSTRNALKAYGPMNIGFNYADIVLFIYSSYK